MVDKKKMSVAEMLAAARKADSGGDAPGEPVEKAESSPSAGEAKPAAASASGERPSVADILAAARGGGATGPSQPAEKPAAKKPAAKPAAKKPDETKPAEPRDTASILASARKSTKAGPMSKSEAAAKAKAVPAAKQKPQIVVPPMPPKPAYAMAKGAAPAAKAKEADDSRRGFLNLGFWGLGAVLSLWALETVRFMFPNVRREPPSKFKVGLPDAFPLGQVQTKYKAQFGVWVVNGEYNGEQQLYALKTVCTHLGCTPNWLEAEQKFKCPCHGSGYYKDGINFEGPAPRPLERFAIHVASDGQVEIDKSRTFQEELGQWADPACYIPV